MVWTREGVEGKIDQLNRLTGGDYRLDWRACGGTVRIVAGTGGERMVSPPASKRQSGIVTEAMIDAVEEHKRMLYFFK